MDSDYLIIGGGVVGLSVAFGLVRLGKRVTVFDEGDGAFRASRGNFGLIWVQSKGVGAPHYARWTRQSAKAWADHAAELEEGSGVKLHLQQQGGFDYHLEEDTLRTRASGFEALKSELGGDYPFEVLDHDGLRRMEPNIGPEVVGATFHHEDGHVNPLRLLMALAAEVRRRGGAVRTDAKVVSVTKDAGVFRVETRSGDVATGGKLLLTAGLGAMDLGPKLGFKAPISPLRGQVLITEKTDRLINRPATILRQVDDGGVQIGDSQENVGFDDRETLAVTARIAARAIRIFPALAKARLVRSWSALRIMSPDGLPIYQQSETFPGAYLITCHSGITLSAAHARFLPLWLEESADAPKLEKFSEDRFPVC